MILVYEFVVKCVDYVTEVLDVSLQIVELDLATVVPCCSGPKRPHDRVSVTDMKADFATCLTNKVGFKGYGLADDKLSTAVPFVFEDQEYTLKHGDVVISAITSCTNTSNPSVMLGAGNNDNENENILFDHNIQIYITDLQ